MPWKGLSGRDPLEDLTDEERGERAWEDWSDAMYDDDDPDRPQRRRPTGREIDVVPPVVHEVAVTVDPEIAAAFAARQAEATEGRTWDVDGGRVTVVGDVKTWSGPCIECGQAFTQRRFTSQRRKWRRLCGEACSAERRRAANRERMRAARAAEGDAA
ncbi:hypothetical protein BIV24_17090 [Streptomyces colonosanans]|uniref:Uncharacterized protein n=2 Tax=Streptomyces colonosanans TaxID=1428652 RepID=A0A1S2PD78_9ACTN|nr:hypothetical protein BIV24_17090 [Streptomyces colonosanans]